VEKKEIVITELITVSKNKKLYCQNCGATINKWTATIVKINGKKRIKCVNCGSTKISSNDPFDLELKEKNERTCRRCGTITEKTYCKHCKEEKNGQWKKRSKRL